MSMLDLCWILVFFSLLNASISSLFATFFLLSFFSSLHPHRFLFHFLGAKVRDARGSLGPQGLRVLDYSLSLSRLSFLHSALLHSIDSYINITVVYL